MAQMVWLYIEHEAGELDVELFATEKGALAHVGAKIRSRGYLDDPHSLESLTEAGPVDDMTDAELGQRTLESDITDFITVEHYEINET